MYIRILKRDLKRKRTMNVILLLFITLASMFVSSSVNNIVSVTTALDDYFEMADAPDYLGATMNKSTKKDITELLDEVDAVERYQTEEMLYLANTMFSCENKELDLPNGTLLFHGDENLSMKFFLEDNSVLTDVAPGELYVSAKILEQTKLSVGDRLTLSVEGITKDFRVAGGFKDAVLGANSISMARYIVDATEFAVFTENSEISSLYGGTICYIETADTEAMLAELGEDAAEFVFSMDREFMRFCYVFDMIVAGILLAASILLIVISFVVLRFTITFTLSEEYREIGVMKAIGIKNSAIRRLYLVKYAMLAVIGAVVGLFLSFPFGQMLMDISSKSIILTGENAYTLNVLCSVIVVAVILLFSYGCTRKVTRFTPVDAIRNGQTGERFRKKSLMKLGKTKLGTTVFLAGNDIVSSPKRYGIMTLTFSLCLSITLVLSAASGTLKSKNLLPAFGVVESHALVNIDTSDAMNFMKEDGRKVVKEYLARMEEALRKHNMPATCAQDMAATLTVKQGEKKLQVMCFQATGVTADQFSYLKGTPPEAPGEVAVTKRTADKLGAHIGDTITIVSMEGERDYIITALYQSMNTRGEGVRLHETEEINYIQTSGAMSANVIFHDNPGEAEVEQRVKEMNTFMGEYGEVITASEWVERSVGVSGAIDAIKVLMLVLTVLLVALVTVLMERSFIAKEAKSLALMKAMGFRNRNIYGYHTLRFALVGAVSVVVAELLTRPLLKLCIDPIFRMMGLETSVEYVIQPLEAYAVLPAIVLATTVATAFLTVLYTRKIKAADVAGLE